MIKSLSLLIVSLVSLCAFAKNDLKNARFKRVIYIVLENKDFRDVIRNTEFRALAQQGANFTNFYAETHPSQPNYIAMIAGDPLGVNSNDKFSLTERHLGDLLMAKGLDWRVYAEDYPGNCFLGSKSGAYARKHVPFLSFKNVQTDSEQCSKIKNFSSLTKDWQNNQLAEFSLLIPNNKNNSHDTTIDFSAQWISDNIKPFLNNEAMMKDTLVVITYDEGSYGLMNQIYTVLIGPSVKSESVNSDPHSHYSLLRLLEEEWGLDSLGRGDLHASSILQIWR